MKNALIGFLVGVLLTAGLAVFLRRPPLEQEAIHPPPQLAVQPVAPMPPPREPPAVTAEAAAVEPMPSLRGTVVVTAQPPGAKVQLDDSTPILVPATFKDLVPGTRHELVISSPGYEVKRIPILVGAGDSNYDINLTPLVSHRRKASHHMPPSGPALPDNDVPPDPWGR